MGYWTAEKRTAAFHYWVRASPTIITLGWPSDAKDYDSARRLRSAVASLSKEKKYLVKMDCFNQDEADRISELLTDNERRRVHFTWLYGGARRRKCECVGCTNATEMFVGVKP